MNWTSQNNKNNFLLYTLKWMGVYITIGFIAAVLLPFPASLLAAIGGYLVVNFLRTRFALKKVGINTKQFFDSIRSSTANQSATMYEHNRLRYYCMACGNQHREIACPKCGSKMKRVG